MHINEMTPKEREEFLFQELLNEIIIDQKGALLKLTPEDLRQLTDKIGLSRGLIEGVFGYDSTQTNRTRHLGTKNKFAEYRGYKNFKGFVDQYMKRTSNTGGIKISGEQGILLLLENMRKFYTGAKHFNQINVFNATSKDMAFSMSDFYMDISYIDRSELRVDNDYLTVEKEGFSYRKNKKARSEIFTNYFSVDVVTEKLVLKDNQVVFVGNPGVGKTTYAKWICYQWSQGKLNLERVPIYIPCRELVPTNKNAISEYVNEMYNRGVANDVNGFLCSPGFSYTLILDGYDEASKEQRIAIEKDLKQFSSQGNQVPYVLLSRPYALINSSFRKSLSFYELVGFNDLNMIKYIRGFFDRAGKEENLEEFIDFISSVAALKDLAHNPLNLAYLASIFCSENGPAILKTIHSSYDLHKEALRFVINYHAEEKQIDKAEFLTLLQPCIPFIAEMEIDLRFVYHENGVFDDNFKYANTLSRLGLGRLEHNKTSNAWSFYAINIHYQETLAAEYFGPRLTKDGLLYLIANPLYWNFIKLLVGFLTVNNGHSVIIQTLKELRLSKRGYGFYLYFIIIGELSDSFVNQLLKRSEIDSLIELYESVANDSLWNSFYLESLTKIYEKLNPSAKLYFQKVIIAKLSASIATPGDVKPNGLSPKQITGLIFPDYLFFIIGKLELCNFKGIAEALVKTYVALETFSFKFFKWAEADLAADKENLIFHYVQAEIDKSGSRLLSLLNQVKDYSLIQPYSDLLWKAYSYSEANSASLIKTIGLFTSAEEFISKFDKLKSMPGNQNYLLSLMCLGMTSSFDYDSHYPKIKDCLLLLKDHLEKGKKKFPLDRPAKEYFAQALAATNDPELFPYLVWANLYPVDSYHSFSELPAVDCEKIVMDFFERKRDLKLGTQDLEEFHATVASLSMSPFILEKYYHEFFSFFNRFVEYHWKEMQEIAYKESDDGLISHPIAEELYGCPDTLYYPAMISVFLNDILPHPMAENIFIKQNFILFLLSCDIPLYEKSKWDLIIGSFKYSRNPIQELIRIFHRNDTIYLYESNLPFLKVFWEEFSLLFPRKNMDKNLRESLPFLLSMAYKSVKFSHELGDGRTDDGLIKTIATFLKGLNSTKLLYQDANLFLEGLIETFAIYPLLAFHTKDKYFLLGSNFLLLFEQFDNMHRVRFLSELAELCKFKPEIFKKSLPLKIWKQLEKYCYLYHWENRTVSLAPFKSMLKNTA